MYYSVIHSVLHNGSPTLQTHNIGDHCVKNLKDRLNSTRTLGEEAF